ncbi:MAG: hypothetical protein EBU46_00155 [Nitrosomonadaceae bacterium]|nr:hypothetical protein [Nitrosomonadaceae bacterium]
MIEFEGTAVAIKYITTLQCYEWTPVASTTKCYGIRIYIDGHPNNAALSATFNSQDLRDAHYKNWIAKITDKHASTSNH